MWAAKYSTNCGIKPWAVILGHNLPGYCRLDVIEGEATLGDRFLKPRGVKHSIRFDLHLHQASANGGLHRHYAGYLLQTFLDTEGAERARKTLDVELDFVDRRERRCGKQHDGTQRGCKM